MAKTMRGAEDPNDAELAAGKETDEKPQEKQYVEVEYVGHPPYGTEFLSSHTIRKSPASGKNEALSFAGQGIDVPEDLVWRKETGWKVKVDASLTDLLDALRTQSDLKVRD